MAKHKYPRIGEIGQKKTQGQCVICKENKADRWIHVQVNIFRGDDESYKAHKKCIIGMKHDDMLAELGYI